MRRHTQANAHVHVYLCMAMSVHMCMYANVPCVFDVQFLCRFIRVCVTIYLICVYACACL